METWEEELARAARVLVQSMLRVGRGERFVAVGDRETVSILAALEAVARDLGAEVATLRIDELRSHSTNHSGMRPHKTLPDAVRRAMLSAQASVFVASAPEAEASMREQLQHVVLACQVRHAHLPGVSLRAFSSGLAVEHAQLTSSASALLRLVESGAVITSTCDDGTSLIVHPGPNRWVARLGRVQAGESVLFPTGSLMVSPKSVRGSFAATASVGAPHEGRERLLGAPVLFDIVESRVTRVRCPACPELVREVEAVLAAAPNSERVGLVVLGLNTGAASPSGSVVLDQHRPGLHLIMGDPQHKLTRASWTARTSLVACATANAVQVDEVPVMQFGRLLFF